MRHVLLALFVATPLLAIVPDDGHDCPDDSCVCAATTEESKVQPGFNESCIQTVEVVVTTAAPGCCKLLEEPCNVAKKCEWEDIDIVVTAEDGGSCPIRRVDPLTGKGETALSLGATPITFLYGDQASHCGAVDEEPEFRLEAKVAGAWKKVWELQLNCARCPAAGDWGGGF